MPYPQECQIATMTFTDFLGDVKMNADLQTRHMAYTMTQGVFQVFRRRLTLQDAIRFSNMLPARIRAFFVADWEPDEQNKPFTEWRSMLEEVAQLRAQHNFSFMTDDAIRDVAKALRNYVDCELFNRLLNSLPDGVRDFWDTE